MSPSGQSKYRIDIISSGFLVRRPQLTLLASPRLNSPACAARSGGEENAEVVSVVTHVRWMNCPRRPGNPNYGQLSSCSYAPRGNERRFCEASLNQLQLLR